MSFLSVVNGLNRVVNFTLLVYAIHFLYNHRMPVPADKDFAGLWKYFTIWTAVRTTQLGLNENINDFVYLPDCSRSILWNVHSVRGVFVPQVQNRQLLVPRPPVSRSHLSHGTRKQLFTTRDALRLISISVSSPSLSLSGCSSCPTKNLFTRRVSSDTSLTTSITLS